MKIYIDAGHRSNINDRGAVHNGQRESVLALQIAKKLKVSLENSNIICFMSRESENDILTNAERCRKANNLKVDLFVSIHLNSASNTSAKGIEVWYYDDQDLSRAICDKMCKYTGAINRGPKQNKAFEVLNSTKMTAVLVECGFLSNKEETQLLINEKYQDKLVKGISEAILEKYKIVVYDKPVLTPIMAKPRASVSQMQAWAKAKGGTETFIANAALYNQVCLGIEVDPVMAYVQYALESGYGAHKGTVPESYCNPCGLKVSNGGSDTDKNAHFKFNSWKDGITAHVDHIALYAGAKGYPKANTLDPRHFPYLYNKYKNVEEIGAGWCPSNPKYSETLLRMIKEIQGTVIKDEFEQSVHTLVAAGIIGSPDYWLKVTDANTRSLIIKMAKYIEGRA